MAKKKTIKDVEAEEKVTKNKKKADKIEEKETVEETEVVEEIEETEVEEPVEDKKEKKNKKNTKEEKESKKEGQTKKEGYFALVVRELKKVVWPKAGSIVKYSLAVIIFCLILCLFFIGIDLIASFIKGLFV